ncbi:MAG: DUF3540 domain-containing protein [Myxococcota bacterium]
MSIATAPTPRDEVFQETATVVAKNDVGFVVVAGDLHLDANRARGCLMAPEVGDRVLLATSHEGVSWVLTVLDRETETPTTVEVEGDLNLRSEGRMSLVGRGLALFSSDDLTAAAGRLELRALRGSVAIEQIGVVADALVSKVDEVRSTSKTVDWAVGRLTQRLERSFRRVAELDHLRAKQIDHSAEQLMSLRSDTAVVTAEQLVKVDGKQIHLG